MESINKCGTHVDEDLCSYCVQHDKLLCKECKVENHNRCRNIFTISEASVGCKTGTALADLESRLLVLKENFQRSIEQHEENREKLINQKDNLLREIKETREAINAYIDDLERDIVENLNSCFHKCHTDIGKNLSVLKDDYRKLESWDKSLDDLKEHASESRLFIGIKYLDCCQYQMEQTFQTLQENVKLSNLSFSETNILDKLKTNKLSFGNIDINMREQTIDCSSKMKHVQAQTTKGRINHATLLYKIHTNQMGLEEDFEMLKVCSSSDQKIIVMGNKPMLWICDKSGIVLHNIPLDFYPSDIKYVSNNCILVAIGSFGICKIDLDSNNTKTYIIKSDSGCLAVAYHNGIIYTTSAEDNLVLLDENGKVLQNKTINMQALDITVDNRGQIYVSDGKQICKIKDQGREAVVTYNDNDENEISGITVDNRGRLYYSNETSGTIKRLDKNLGERLTIVGNLERPRGLTYNKIDNCLVIISDDGDSLDFYDMR